MTVEERLEEKNAPEPDGDAELGGKMTFIQHLEELRRRLIVGIATFAGCFVTIYAWDPIRESIKDFFTRPIVDVLNRIGSSLIYTGIAEGFLFDLKVSAVAALFIASPMLFYQAWAFVAPGLYKKERFYLGPLILSSTLFFTGGAAFFYFAVFPMAANFFSTFALNQQIQWMPKLEEVFSFVIVMTISFGFTFELPVIVFILARLNIVSAAFLNRNRKYAILIIVIIAAILTPPDVLSQVMLATPMWILFEISVLVAWIFGPKAKKAEPEAEDKPVEEE